MTDVDAPRSTRPSTPKRLLTHAFAGLCVGFVVATALLLLDLFLLTPGGAAYWVDDFGRRVAPGTGVPVYHQHQLQGEPMGWVILAASLGAFLAFELSPLWHTNPAFGGSPPRAEPSDE